MIISINQRQGGHFRYQYTNGKYEGRKAYYKTVAHNQLIVAFHLHTNNLY
jgi:hypothetical protein